MNAWQQVYHFDGGQCRFFTFVSNLAAGSIQRLVHGFAGDYSKSDRDACRLGDRHDTGRDLTVDVFVMSRRSLNNGTQANDGFVSTGFCQSFGGKWYFERSGNVYDVRLFTIATVSLDRRNGAIDKSTGDKIVKPRDNNGDRFVWADQGSLDEVCHWKGVELGGGNGVESSHNRADVGMLSLRS